MLYYNMPSCQVVSTFWVDVSLSEIHLKFLCYANVFNLLHVHELYFMYNNLLPMPPIKASTVVKFNQSYVC